MIPAAMLRTMGLDPEKVKVEMEKAMQAAERMAQAFEEIVKILERLEKKVDQLEIDLRSLKSVPTIESIPGRDGSSTGDPLPLKTYTVS